MRYTTPMQLQVGVKVLLYNQHDELLLLRRSRVVSDGSIVWDIPGGRIEAHEALEAGLKRELLEECGVTAHIDPELLAAQDISVGTDRHVVRLTYRARIDQLIVKLSDEHNSYVWASPHALSDYEVDPLIRDVLSRPIH